MQIYHHVHTYSEFFTQLEEFLPLKRLEYLLVDFRVISIQFIYHLPWFLVEIWPDAEKVDCLDETLASKEDNKIGYVQGLSEPLPGN